MKTIVFIALLLTSMVVIGTHSLSAQDWELTESNSWITDIPTVYDFMPLGVTCIETADHQIIYPPDDPKWRLR